MGHAGDTALAFRAMRRRVRRARRCLSCGRGRAKASPLRILLSEGSSTSAREGRITIFFGMQGHHVEVCDPDPRCLGCFSRFVRRFHRCPGLGVDPGRLCHLRVALLAEAAFGDVLLPIQRDSRLLRFRQAVENQCPPPPCRHLRRHQENDSKPPAALQRARPPGAGPPPHARATRAGLKRLPRPPATAAARWTVLAAVLMQRRAKGARAQAARSPTSSSPSSSSKWPSVEHAQAALIRGRLLGMHAHPHCPRRGRLTLSFTASPPPAPRTICR